MSISSDVLHRWPRSVPILDNGTPLLPPAQICPFYGWSGPSSNTWFPGPTRILSPNGISIGASATVFAGLTSVTTDDKPRYTLSVTIGRIYVRSTAMRPNNNSIKIQSTKCNAYKCLKILNENDSRHVISRANIKGMCGALEHLARPRELIDA